MLTLDLYIYVDTFKCDIFFSLARQTNWVSCFTGQRELSLS